MLFKQLVKRKNQTKWKKSRTRNLLFLVSLYVIFIRAMYCQIAYYEKCSAALTNTHASTHNIHQWHTTEALVDFSSQSERVACKCMFCVVNVENFTCQYFQCECVHETLSWAEKLQTDSIKGHKIGNLFWRFRLCYVSCMRDFSSD